MAREAHGRLPLFRQVPIHFPISPIGNSMCIYVCLLVLLDNPYASIRITIDTHRYSYNYLYSSLVVLW